MRKEELIKRISELVPSGADVVIQDMLVINDTGVHIPKPSGILAIGSPLDGGAYRLIPYSRTRHELKVLKD